MLKALNFEKLSGRAILDLLEWCCIFFEEQFLGNQKCFETFVRFYVSSVYQDNKG